MGECQVNRENIEIYDKDLRTAKMLCATIADTDKRSKALADVIGARVAVEYFDKDSYEVDNSTSLHNIPSIVEAFDIADIYVNGAYIDVRVYFSDDEICVPKIHYDLNITPALYMFIKLSQDLTQAEVTGFIRPESVNINNTDGNVYFVSKDTLESIYDVETRIQKVLDVESIDNKTIYDFASGNLGETDMIEIIKKLQKSTKTRLKLQKIYKAQSIFNLVSSISVPENFEEIDSEQSDTVSDLDELFENDNNSEVSEDNELLEFSTEVTPSGADLIESLDNEEALTKANAQENSEIAEEQADVQSADDSLETLFTGEQEGVPVSTKKKGNSFVTLLIFLLLIGGGYALYTNYFNKNEMETLPETQDTASQEVVDNSAQVNKEEPMPVETVESVSNASKTDEASPISVPAIEQNIDASILVSNLKIDWEVPAGYASNTAAKRYFVKLGKIIQLNLKTELLLLHKPPLSNKITVELTYNSGKNKFDIAGIRQSSGEKVVDDVIIQTVQTALGMNLNTNSESFANIQGNPILIIRL